MPRLKIEKFGSGKEWFFHIQSRNGEIIAPSEAYKTRQSRDRAVERWSKYLSACTLKVVDLAPPCQ